MTVPAEAPAGSPTSTGYRRPLRNREFRALVVAQITSECGDHVARVALAALVLDRLDSALLAALAFALGYAPALLGGSLLAPLADRMPRRRLMLVCDALRAVLVGAMALLAVDGTPVLVLFVLLLLAALFTVPFEAARSAVLPDVLPVPREYLAGMSLCRVLYQVNQVTGLTLAGLVVHVLSPRWALGLDALTFAVSFLIVLARPAPAARAAGAGERRGGLLADARAGAAVVFGHRVLRMLVLLAWCAAIFLIAAEGVALAYARDHGWPDIGGALMASVPAGGAVGAWLLGRARPSVQLRLMLPLATAACLPLLLTGLNPPVWAALVLWFCCGACQGFIVTILATVNLLTPRGYRGRVNGLGAAGFSLANALSFLLVGYVADLCSPAAAVAAAGFVGLAVLAPIWLAWPTRELRREVRMVYDADPGPTTAAG